MKITSWNLNFWQNWTHQDKEEWRSRVLDYLKSLDYDFMLLQEVKVPCLFSQYTNSSGIDFLGNSLYYHELGKDELTADPNSKILLWGNSIIAKNNYRIQKRRILEKDYYGRSILMCYDFYLPDEKTITLINFYGKKAPDSNDYPILEKGINDIKDVVQNNSDNHLIVFAGDFNSDPEKEPHYKKVFFDNLEELGFKNCTQAEVFRNTMVPEARPWPNDKVFVNKPYHEYTKCILREDTDLKLSDHRPIECIINLEK
jgi:exonuclease III